MAKTIDRRYDALLIWDVLDGNPNGDPEFNGGPRTDPQTRRAIVSDVSQKRHVRDYVQMRRADIEAALDGEYGIAMQHGSVLTDVTDDVRDSLKSGDTTAHGRAIARAEELYDKKKGAVAAKAAKKDEKKALEMLMAREYLMAQMFDVRAFGAVITDKAGDGWGQITGPVQFEFGRSVEDVAPTELTITSCGLTSRGGKNESNQRNQTMGTKHILPYALFTQGIHVSPTGADETGFTDDDLALLWHSVMNMHELQRSAASGRQTSRMLVVFDHGNRWGKCSSARLFEAVKVRRAEGSSGPARDFSDYVVEVDEDALPAGVSVTVYRDGDEIVAGL